MTLSAGSLLFYSGALLVLFFTPGPVWVALTARTLTGGFAAAWPLAVGVVLGDALWPLVAIFGLGWVLSVFNGFMILMRLVAAATFAVMGLLLFRNAGQGIVTDSRLTPPGRLAGFMAGVAVILGNPKAILFYMGVLPGFFDLSRVTAADIAVIVLVSMLIPLIGNLGFALFIDRARRLLASPIALRRTNRVAGVLLMLVGVVIALS